MKNGKLQVKDIPTQPILKFISEHGWDCNPFGNKFEKSVTHAMPEGMSNKFILAKMKSLINKGLVKGCACGCRGDFALTVKGRSYLNNE